MTKPKKKTVTVWLFWVRQIGRRKGARCRPRRKEQT